MQSRDKIIAGTDELADGEMKEVTVVGQKLLLVRCGDEYHTTVANCPRYGAPLAQGALNGTRVVCP
jgi:3-phenylpropionate/trans-cinnamate dioxygenase ferredoxin reductase subunit